MYKKFEDLKIGDILVMESGTKLYVVVGATNYLYLDIAMVYLEYTQLFSAEETVIRNGFKASDHWECIDDEYAAKLYSLHKGEEPIVVPRPISIENCEKLLVKYKGLKLGDIYEPIPGQLVRIVRLNMFPEFNFFAREEEIGVEDPKNGKVLNYKIPSDYTYPIWRKKSDS